MGSQLTVAPEPDSRLSAGPVHRSIVLVDIEGSTLRTNVAKGTIRGDLYDILDRALGASGISARHLEPHSDRGDGVLILIRPHDDVPKTLLLGRLIPVLSALLTEHNAAAARPELRLRLRAVIHAGEVHEDARGFYGDDVDTAFRLLAAPGLKKALREAVVSPLVLAVSEEIFTGVVQQEYPDAGRYQPLIKVRVGRRQRRGWVTVPVPVALGRPGTAPRPAARFPVSPLALAPASGHGR